MEAVIPPAVDGLSAMRQLVCEGRSQPGRRPALFRSRSGSWRWWLLGFLAAGAALAAIAPDGPSPLQRVPSFADPADAPTDRPDHRWQ